MSILRRAIPRWIKSGGRAWIARAKHFGSRRLCNICGSRLNEFIAHGASGEPDFLCPVCWSKPPHRLACGFLRSHSELFVAGGHFVHIAPEPGLGPLIHRMAKRRGMRYQAGSISGQGEAFLNLFELPFEDESIDSMYCCHVLNSLQNDLAAMREVHRVMRPTGTALLQVPAFHAGPHTLETTCIEERLSMFGDEGIFRCYTPSDYIQRLQSVGFVVDVYRASELPEEQVTKFGLKKEVLHVCRRAV